jgi:hypothetical protein
MHTYLTMAPESRKFMIPTFVCHTENNVMFVQWIVKHMRHAGHEAVIELI